MFRRKLTALDYHNPAGFNCKGEEAAPGPQRDRDRPAAAFSAPASGLSTWTVRGLVSPAPFSSQPHNLTHPLGLSFSVTAQVH